MSMKAFLMDTETTGLVSNSRIRLEKQPHIIELFGLSLDNDSYEELGVWQSLFNHHKPLDKKIIQITGITDELIKDAPLFYTKAAELKTHIETHDIVVAHNLTYDMAMVDNEMSRCNLKVNWPAVRFCTVEQSEFVCGFRLSLTLLYEKLFNEGFKNAHRAETDVRALTKCYIEMRKRGWI